MSFYKIETPANNTQSYAPGTSTNYVKFLIPIPDGMELEKGSIQISGKLTVTVGGAGGTSSVASGTSGFSSADSSPFASSSPPMSSSSDKSSANF